MHKLSESNVFKDNLFLARSWKILPRSGKILAKIAFFVKNEKVLQDCCKNFARRVFYKNFAKVVLIERILQDFGKSCFSCELG